METEELQQYLNDIEQKKGKGKQRARRDLLRYIRHRKIRRQDLVLLHSAELLPFKQKPLSLQASNSNISNNSSSNASILGDEIWSVTEQYLVACLEFNELEIAKECYIFLKERFGSGSLRVMRLAGMLLEAKGKFLQANDIYQQILNKQPTDAVTRRRQICIYKAHFNNIPKAIELTVEYLNEYYMADVAMWHELAELYVNLHSYQKAAFCYEELMVHEPQNYHYITRYAELVYTIGGLSNIRIARKYFAYSLELNKNENIRALYGLNMCCNAIETCDTRSKKEIEKEDANNMKLLLWTRDNIMEIYKNKCSSSQNNELVQTAFGGEE